MSSIISQVVKKDGSATAVKLIKKEAKFLEEIDHPNIVKLLGVRSLTLSFTITGTLAITY